MNKLTIVIADDHKLIRETWASVINSDERFTVIAQCASGEDAINLCRDHRADIIILDINLQGMSGIEATPLIRKYSPGTKILAVSMHKQPSYAKKMIREGAHGYVTKNSSQREMFIGLMEVYKGKKYLCDEIKDILSEQAFNDQQEGRAINSLSQREISIIELIRKGLSSKEIAGNFSISVKTVEVHRHNILKKLKLRNTAALINFVNEQGLVHGV